MPNNYDFSTLRDIKTSEINPNGWVNPLVIEYGIGDDYGPTYFWRVKGTKHTFVIPILRLNFISDENYGTHFKEVLEKFSEEYREWREGGFETPWMREYEDDYKNYIL